MDVKKAMLFCLDDSFHVQHQQIIKTVYQNRSAIKMKDNYGIIIGLPLMTFVTFYVHFGAIPLDPLPSLPAGIPK